MISPSADILIKFVFLPNLLREVEYLTFIDIQLLISFVIYYKKIYYFMPLQMIT